MPRSHAGFPALGGRATTKKMAKRKEVNSMMNLINQLKNMDIDAVDIDNEIALLALAKVVQAEYAAFNAEPPEWLPVRVKQLERDIRSKRQALVEKRIRELENRKMALLPRDKKIENIDHELEMLKKQL